MTRKIQVNGTPQVTQAQTLAQLLRELEMPPQGVAVAVNARVVRRADHADYKLQDDDAVEIIRAVQGG